MHVFAFTNVNVFVYVYVFFLYDKKMVSKKDMEFIDIVWREQREPVSVLTADFIGKFSKFSGWNCLSKFYNVLSSLGAKS